MSPLVIFIVGSVIFAITVYGAVMAGGLLLTRRQFDENDVLELRDTDEDELPDGVLLDVKY